MPKRTTSFRDDLLKDLADPLEAELYLNAASEDSSEMFLVALRDVAEAKQLAKVAQSAGVARESIYRMLQPGGNPTYSSLIGILRSVGLNLKVAADETVSKKPRYKKSNVSFTSNRSANISLAVDWKSNEQSLLVQNLYAYQTEVAPALAAQHQDVKAVSDLAGCAINRKPVGSEVSISPYQLTSGSFYTSVRIQNA